MSDIELACHAAPWGAQGMITALADIERARYKGLEMPMEVVEQYEDRVTVFTEILSQHKLELMGITAGGSAWPGVNLDEEIERGVNVARFLRQAGAKLLNLYPPRPNPGSPLEDDLDLMPAATAYGEIARRSLEHGVQTVLHPERGGYLATPERIDKFLEMADPEALKLCVDIGFLVLSKIEVKEFLQHHKSRLGLVHLSDMKIRESKAKKRPREIVPPALELGKGSFDLKAFVDELFQNNFTGWATIEFDPHPSRSNFELAQACHRFAEQKLDLVL